MGVQEKDSTFATSVQQGSIVLKPIATIDLSHGKFRDQADGRIPSFDRIDEAPRHIELVRTVGQNLTAPHNIEFDEP